MLSLALVTQDEGPTLRRRLQAIAAGLREDEDLIVLDRGSLDDTTPELDAFMGGRKGQLIRLDRVDLSRAEVLELARREAHHPYLLMLEGRDLLLPGALEGLRRILAGNPETVVLNRGWGVGGVEAPLPAPDAARLAMLGDDPDRDALMTLTPDPERLLIRADLVDRLGDDACGVGQIAADMAPWLRLLGESDSVALYPEPLWRSPLPQRSAAPIFEAIAEGWLGTEPIGRAMTWAGDALFFTGPEEAPAILEAAQRMVAARGDALNAEGLADGPATPMIRALLRGDVALALTHLALALAAQERQRNTALATALAKLRHDLDIALPGPDYLRQLYDRIRAR